MLNKLRLLVINVRRTVLFMVCKYIHFLYVKVALTDHERWPKTKQSEDQLLASSTVYAKCNYHALLLYQTHSITSPTTPIPCVLTQRRFVKLLQHPPNHSPSPSRVWWAALPDPGWLPMSPLRIRKIVSNEIHINMCVGVCSLRSSCSKPHSDGVFSQFTSSDSCIRAAFKRKPVHSPHKVIRV